MRPEYLTACGMRSDTYFTGKLYPKLDAFIRNGKDGELFYYCSSCQFRTHKSFNNFLVNTVALAHNAIITIKKGEE